jgi:hypothetical protein
MSALNSIQVHIHGIDHLHKHERLTISNEKTGELHFNLNGHEFYCNKDDVVKALLMLSSSETVGKHGKPECV